MAESLAFSRGAHRAILYEEIVPQITALVEGEPDLTANLANIAAALKQAFDFFWVGFYLAKDGQLVLGPFQGPIACSRIDFGKGVCGQAYVTRETVIVPNVDEFPGHIACASESRSEIVIPIMNGKNCLGVLDVDSDEPDDFSSVDADGLARVVSLVETALAGR